MRKINRLRFLSVVVLGLGAFVEARTFRLQVNGETVVGTSAPTAGVAAFLGVPYALPPTGERRWRAPVAYLGNGGTRSAVAFAPACMQSMRILDWYRDMAQRFGAARSVFADLPISEDCLYLNVWAPNKQRRGGLPVMLFVHGGSNKSGWSYEPNYQGHRLAAQGAVVVSVGYRLGVFGFFSHPELTGEPAVANFGLWDLLAALRWIQRNIAAFGGDPARVTVFGESAGGGNIGVLMLSPAAQGLMHRAIMQSASGFGLPSFDSLANEQARGAQFARSIDATRPPTLAALRAMPAAQLLQYAEWVFRDHYHAPVLDGAIVTRQLTDMREPNNWPLQQLMLGTNANEYYAPVPPDTTPLAIDAALAKSSMLDTPEIRAELHNTRDIARALDRLVTAEQMLCPAQSLATQVARTGRPVWMYRFARVRDGSAAATLGAYHGAELPYVFATHDAWLPTQPIDWRLTRNMQQAWVKFAATGSPNRGRLPTWPAFKGAGPRNVLQFDTQIAAIDTPEPLLCRPYDERVRAASN